MEVAMHAPGLWSWSVDRATCLYHEAPDGIVLADPLVPDAEAERFWRALDRDVERIGRPPTIVVSADSTFRSAGTVRARYPGAVIRAPHGVAAEARDAVLEDAEVLAGGVTAIVPDAAALLTCSCHGLVWTGDVLHGDGDGALRPGPALDSITPGARHALAATVSAGRATIAIPAVGSPVTEAASVAIAHALT